MPRPFDASASASCPPSRTPVLRVTGSVAAAPRGAKTPFARSEKRRVLAAEQARPRSFLLMRCPSIDAFCLCSLPFTFHISPAARPPSFIHISSSFFHFHYFTLSHVAPGFCMGQAAKQRLLLLLLHALLLFSLISFTDISFLR